MWIPGDAEPVLGSGCYVVCSLTGKARQTVTRRFRHTGQGSMSRQTDRPVPTLPAGTYHAVQWQDNGFSPIVFISLRFLSLYFFFFFFLTLCWPQWNFEIRVGFPEESQLQQSRATQTLINYKVHAGSCFHKPSNCDMDCRIFYVRT